MVETARWERREAFGVVVTGLLSTLAGFAMGSFERGIWVAVPWVFAFVIGSVLRKRGHPWGLRLFALAESGFFAAIGGAFLTSPESNDRIWGVICALLAPCFGLLTLDRTLGARATNAGLP